MAAATGDDGRDAGDETHNDVSGNVSGPVFQGRDFGSVNMGAAFPEEAAAYYRRMQQRLDEEERLRAAERERQRRVLVAQRRRILLRLVFSIAWFVLGARVEYDDGTPLFPAALFAVGLLGGPIMAANALQALAENKRTLRKHGGGRARRRP